MKLLMVTREAQADKRFGLGRSLTPIIDGLSARGHTVGYLSRAARSARSEAFCRRLHRWLLPMVRAAGGPQSDNEAVLQAMLERLDMGRLAAKVAQRDGYSHVHLHDPWIALGFMWARAMGGGARRCRWGITEHGFGSYAHAVHVDGGHQSARLAGWLRRLERLVTTRADWVIAPTEAALSQLERDLAVHPRPPHWRAIPHPLPALHLVSREAARARLGWEAEGLCVLGIGRLAPLKRFDLLVRAAARIAPVHPLRLVLLGDGDWDWMRAYGRQCGLPRDIEFALTDDVGLYLSAADLYVSTSSTESFGLANLEAVVAGTPAICAAVGGVPEVVAEAATLVPMDEEAIAAAMAAQLAATPAHRQRQRAIAAARTARWPSQAQIIERYLDAYAA